MLDKVADFYDQEVEATVDALTSLLEPLLIVVMGGAVGGMVVAALHADVQHHQAHQVGRTRCDDGWGRTKRALASSS